ncbi:hypothetical protein [Chitinophaga rhizophila]|uniref:Copper chaperone CopZ n=1 Tax=Chitinophaga rhizophila TaxID=2866212 RepID=A0ABS7GAY6_9BACT|nr:hypothetical protein [Chitinophaga rhizophila]MBW8684828.1 hypothetical protein [Chitinophaga rhizophila]
MVVGIFRTNISTQQDKHTIIEAVHNQFMISSCTIDIEDCDRVMRVLPGTLPVTAHDVIHFVRSQGFDCDLLD